MYLIFVRFSTFINSAVLWQNNINNNHFAALCLGLPGWVGTRSSLTHPPSWSPFNLCQLLPSTTIHSILPVQITCLAIFFAQPLSMSSLVYLLAWSPPPHIPYISSPNQCLLFATHAHIIATSFAVVSILYHLFLAFLLTPYLELYIYLNITHPSDHSHLCSLKTTSFSFLTGQVSLLCSILLRTQLLYSLPLLINDISLLVSNGTNCVNLFHSIWILASRAASASTSTLNISVWYCARTKEKT